MNNENRITITDAGLKLKKQILNDLETERKKQMNTTNTSRSSNNQRNSWSQVDNSNDNGIISHVDFILADNRTNNLKQFFKPTNSLISHLDNSPTKNGQSATPYFGQWQSQLLESSQSQCSQTILNSFRKSVGQHSKDQNTIELYFTSKYKHSKYLRDKGKAFGEKISKSMELIKSERRQLQGIIKGQDILTVVDLKGNEVQIKKQQQQKQLSQQYPQSPQEFISRTPNPHHIKASSSMTSQTFSDGMKVVINNSKGSISRAMFSRAGSNSTALNTSDYSGQNSTSRIYDRIKDLNSIEMNERKSNAFLRLSEKMEKIEKKQISYENLRNRLDNVITRKQSHKDTIGFSPMSLDAMKNQHDNPQQIFQKDISFEKFQHKSKIAQIQDKKYGRFWSKLNA